MKMFLMFFCICFLTISKTNASYYPSDSIPKFTVKWFPLALIDFDPNIQFHFEYFLSSQKSLEAGYGFGNHKLMSWSDNDRMNQFRLQYRSYRKPFLKKKHASSYFGGEFMYKNVLQPEVAIKDTEPFDSDNYHVNVNVAAVHFLVGHQFLNYDGFPVADAFIGLGIRGYKNYNQNLISGYSFQHYTMYNRLEGSGFYPSFIIGFSLGFGGWRK